MEPSAAAARPARKGATKRSDEARAVLSRLQAGIANGEYGGDSQRNIQGEYVALRLRTHVAAVRGGTRCRVCWLHPSNCMCTRLRISRAVVPRGVEVALLFHHNEVGSVSNTGKLLLASGVAVGFVAGLRRADARLLPGKELLNLGDEDDFRDYLAARAGRVAVLYPSEGAVDAARLRWHLAARRALDASGRACAEAGARAARGLGGHSGGGGGGGGGESGPAPPAGAVARAGAVQNAQNVLRADVQRLAARLQGLVTRSARLLLAPGGPPCAVLEPGPNADTAAAAVVVLDGTYRQARYLNRMGELAGCPRVCVTPTAASDLAPVRNQGAVRAEAGRTSTMEAVGLLLEGIDGSCAAHAGAWRSTLRLMVDSARLQRGRSSVYAEGTAPATAPATAQAAVEAGAETGAGGVA